MKTQLYKFCVSGVCGLMIAATIAYGWFVKLKLGCELAPGSCDGYGGLGVIVGTFMIWCSASIIFVILSYKSPKKFIVVCCLTLASSLAYALYQHYQRDTWDLAIAAAIDGNEKSIDAIVARGFDLKSESGIGGARLLAHAAKSGNVAAVGRLLELGVDPSPPLWDLLKYATNGSRQENEQIIQMLVQKGAHLRAKPTQQTPLGDLTSRSEAELLMAAVPNLSLKKTDAKAYALFTAIQHGDKNDARLMLEDKTLVNARDDLGSTTIAVATANNLTDMARELWQAGADPYLASDFGFSAFHWALFRRNRDLLALFLSRPASLNHVDGLQIFRSGWTEMMPLMLPLLSMEPKRREQLFMQGMRQAYFDKNLGLAEMLLRHGADPRIETNSHGSLMSMAQKAAKVDDDRFALKFLDLIARYPKK